MASNFACEAVQRSGGGVPQYLYSPAPDGLAPQFGGLAFDLNVVIANNVAGGTPITAAFQPSANGVYVVDCVCDSDPSFSISATGSALSRNNGATYILSGFNNTNVGQVTGAAPVTAVYIVQLSTAGTPGQLTLYQNSGGPLTYDIRITQISTLVNQ
jgi:hypothetical protein